MLRSVLVGVDDSVYSTAAVALGIRWAQRWDAVLVGLGIVDAPTICKAEPVPLGATAYKVHRDETRLADARQKVAQFLEHCVQQCAKAGVTCQVRQEVGAPAECLLLEAQRYDLIVLGQHTFFHFETQELADDIHYTILKQSPRPVVTVPPTLPAGQVVMVAYDGSLQATRALQKVGASLLVMGAYGRSTLREFFGHSVTRTLLQESPVPLFLYH